MPPQPQADPATRSDLLTRARSILDVAFAGATVLYALGYAAWAVYAVDAELGVPPLLHSQYLVAGVVPALILLSVLGALRGIRWVRVGIRGEPGEGARRIGAIFMAAGVGLLLLGFLGEHVAGLDVPSVVFWAGLAAVFGAIMIAPPDRTYRWFAVGTSWYLSAAVPVLAVVAFVVYSTRIFPHFPSELGGPSPQCVTLDIDASKLSQSTLDKLADTTTRGDSFALRTKPLLLLLEGSSYVLAPVDTTIRGRAFRLKDDVVMAVFRDTDCVRNRTAAQ